MLLDQLSRRTNEQGRITRFSIRDKFVLAAIPKEHYPEPEHLELLIREAMVCGISKHIEILQQALDDGAR